MKSRKVIMVIGALFLVVPVVLLSRFIYIQWTSQSILRALLDGDAPYSLADDAETLNYVHLAVPKLIQLHQSASSLFTKDMYGRDAPNAHFNQRVTSWRGLIDAFDISDNEDAKTYIRDHISSKEALSEEVDVVKQVLGAEWRLRLGDDSPINGDLAMITWWVTPICGYCRGETFRASFDASLEFGCQISQCGP